MQGRIELIYGPMFSGKSSELIRKVKRFIHANKKCLIINYEHDNRYSSQSMVSTHDKVMMNALKIQKLQQIDNIYKDYEVIAIDEGQFFDDIVEKSDFFANQGKIVIIAALDATFERKPFGNIVNLLPLSESITKLSSVCVQCGADASFTKRTIENDKVQLIGGDEMYQPVCRQCFNLYKNKVMNNQNIQPQLQLLIQNSDNKKETQDNFKCNKVYQ